MKYLTISLINSTIPGLSLDNASIIPGKNEIADKIPTMNGASILITVTSCKRSHDIAFAMVMMKPKNMSKLKL